MKDSDFTVREFKKSRLYSLRGEVEKFGYIGSLWIIDIEKLKKVVVYPDIDVQEVYLPALVIERNVGGFLLDFVVFTSLGGAKVFLDFDRCNCLCLDKLKDKKYRLLLNYKESNELRRVFRFDIRDVDRFMEFCGMCNLNYVREIKRIVDE